MEGEQVNLSGDSVLLCLDAWAGAGRDVWRGVEYNHLIIPIIIIIIIHLWLPGLDFLLLSNLTGTNYSEITPLYTTLFVIDRRATPDTALSHRHKLR